MALERGGPEISDHVRIGPAMSRNEIVSTNLYDSHFARHLLIIIFTFTCSANYWKT